MPPDLKSIFLRRINASFPVLGVLVLMGTLKAYAQDAGLLECGSYLKCHKRWAMQFQISGPASEGDPQSIFIV